LGYPTIIFAARLLRQDVCLSSIVNVIINLFLRIMEFKLRANIVMSKELTIEAEHLAEALEKAQAMMTEPVPMKELTTRDMYFDVLSDIK
jgi:hypothetical protein